MHSSFSDKKRKIANSFRNTSYENKLSKVVKLTEIWIMNALKCEEEDDKVFCCNAHIISEICGISGKKINIKKAPAPTGGLQFY